MILYTVYDRVAEQCGPVFEARNSGIAARNFRQLMRTVPKVDLDVYDLVKLGVMDKDSMKITLVDPEVVEVDLGALYLGVEEEQK